MVESGFGVSLGVLMLLRYFRGMSMWVAYGRRSRWGLLKGGLGIRGGNALMFVYDARECWSQCIDINSFWSTIYLNDRSL